MGSNEIKSIRKNSANYSFSSLYRSKPKVQKKLIALPLILFISIFAFVNFSNSPNEKTAESLSSSREKTIESSTSTTLPIKNEFEESCEDIAPIYGGVTATKCIGNKYTKINECFQSESEIETIITKFSINDQSYSSENILFREGEVTLNGFNSYRIFAIFKNNYCIVDLTSNIEDKAVLYSVFDASRAEAKNNKI